MSTGRSRSRRRRLAIFLSAAALVLVIVVLALDHWLPYMLLAHYKFSVEAHPKVLDEYGATAEPVEFTTSDGVPIRGWFIPAPAGEIGRAHV